MDRNFGYRKDRDDHGMPDLQDIAHKFKLVTVPKAINYRAQVLKGPGIMDQGQVGSCFPAGTPILMGTLLNALLKRLERGTL
jgi:hypothetical protein